MQRRDRAQAPCYRFPMLVCQQPHYLPWLGYYELFRRADAFVFLDDVQWTRQGRQHRTRVIDLAGRKHWLTVPVHGHGHRELALKDMRVDTQQAWARRHWETIRACYGAAPYFKSQLEPILRPYFEKAQGLEFLVDVSQESLYAFWEAFGLSTELHWASDTPGSEEKSERLASLCRRLGHDHYYSVLGSTRYLDLALFREWGVRVLWQHFRPSFPGQPLRSLELSVVDWVAHLPLEEVRARLEPLRPLLAPEEPAAPQADR